MSASSDIFIRQLSGYSGARVDLLKSTKDGRLFVRKSVGQELTLTVGQDLKGVGYNFLMRSISLSKRQFVNGVK